MARRRVSRFLSEMSHTHTRFLCGDDFYIWSGNDDQVVPMMALGAKGVISVASNIVPEVMVKMSHLCLENDFAAASQLQIQYMDLIDALFTEVRAEQGDGLGRLADLGQLLF